MISDEAAKATQEVAKLGQRSLDTADRAGGYFAETFREAITHLAAAAGDTAEGFRIRNRAAVIQKTARRLQALGTTRDYSTVTDRLALPLIDALSLEGDATIQDMWANYIANALNPDRPAVAITRVLINVIRALEPEDLPVLRRIFEVDLEQPLRDPIVLTSDDFSRPEEEMSVTLARLASLGLFSFSNVTALLLAGGNMDIELPCRLSVITRMGTYSGLPLLLLLKQATD